MLPAIIDYLKNKSVLILGFGREGQSTLKYIRDFLPEKQLTVADKNNVSVDDENVSLICGENYLECVNDFELVMKSPGISFLDVTVKEGTEITCQTDMFVRFAPCRKVGITGSKGKTTTSTLIYDILKAAGFDARLMGNIGIPVFDSLEQITKDTIAVIEMSSHQLEFTKASPEVAVLTNIYEEHLDHYKGGFSGYVNAKLNIMRSQTEGDLFIYNATQGVDEYIELNAVKAETCGIGQSDEIPFEVNNEHLLGVHNRQDILFACAAAKAFGADNDACFRGVSDFSGIEHRMEKVGTFKDITFYNDCIATIPHAVMCAVEALKNVDTLIIGGKDRGLDYSDFEKALESSNISNIIGTPETGYSIVKNLLNNKCEKNLIAAKDLEEAVKAAYKYTEKGKICLLSPAASSYNVYKNFEEKGKHYKQLIKQYGE